MSRLGSFPTSVIFNNAEANSSRVAYLLNMSYLFHVLCMMQRALDTAKLVSNAVRICDVVTK